ncbi:MAG: succinate--CoA ligase subunit alpha [Desulfurella sp.]|uniref:succinate--CoA ligase subunit alpha n=1 Tax=Desulfurella TaxID=33001 RepID=UPI0003E08E18|nr:MULTISPECIES: succinate--CoA ligase subunit alpha [Desulfurella]AHF97285.1 succinyl-CoA synthetase subsunit alpha [Desulfurella acetivorans A63]HEX12929.1 succinate--CoA ligase subunit alpha [Desulfurella acetivorans]PMP63743.1 MAG: succinate--CoA ligase subunit alpha [Desulfurella multipotens]PMP69147.1 MAG: succinate--CoA ligase subunit alpha [Desulfurella multipotens]PMP93156.1 MAG: succinate--CoA ligase subunit alpha [Desulfurella sp.]
MAIAVYKTSRVIVQGITGKEGRYHALACRDYGTKVVGGVTPGKGGSDVDGIPVFNTVEEAVQKTNPNVSLIFVPPPFAADAILEAVGSGIKIIVCITEGIPVLDMVKVKRVIEKEGIILIGPNCPGIITPDASKIGIMPGHIFKRGSIGIISRSGTLLYETADQISKVGLGQSTCLGIGGDPIVGTDYIFWLERFEQDPETEAIMIVGEIGGDAEEKAAEYIKAHVTKPVFAFVAGASAPKGRRMGHAGAIIMGKKGTVESKYNALKEAGVHIIENPGYIGETIYKTLKEKYHFSI